MDDCENGNELLRKIPKIDRLMELEMVKALCEQYGHQIVLDAARNAQKQLREALQMGRYAELECLHDGNIKEQNIRISSMLENQLLEKMKELLFRQNQMQMQRVINATGVFLHTNLGRAPLGEKLVSELAPLMTGYTNLEINLKDGKRGSRYDHFSENLCRLTGDRKSVV